MNNHMVNKDKSDKCAYVVIGIVSALVLAFLFWLIYFKDTVPIAYGFARNLPTLNAFLNLVTSVLLVLGFIFIKRGQREKHIYAMLGATVTSALFFISYIISHHYHGDTKFLAQGFVRSVYFFILISHIALSVIQVPMIFVTLYHAGKRNYIKHKKAARITFPIWLYVSVTGVLVFIFLKLFNVVYIAS